jgi:hypothetical protein
VLKIFRAILGLCVCGLWLSVHAADNYALADGTTLSGDIVTFNDAGIILRLAGDKYTERMPWTQFSQEGLQQLAQNPKIKPLVDPFMELPATETTRHTEDIQVKDVTRLAMPPHKSLFGGLATSSVGLFLLFLAYAANLYAAFEVAVCRGRPLGTVIGLSAVVPVVVPAVFFLMPTLQIAPVTNITSEETTAATTFAVAGVTTDAGKGSDIQVSAEAAGKSGDPTTQTFKRGQFTFNRRFFETKFAGFSAPARSEADQKLEFSVKLPSGQVVVERIARLGQNDIHFEVLLAGQPREMAVAFADIQEITLKPKPA